MGMHFKDIKYFEEMTDWLLYREEIKSLDLLQLCELGDLWIRSDLHNYTKHRTAKQYFESKGINVTVIDLGIGQDKITEGVLQYDLTKPLPTDIGLFDFIVDFGTAEHIENQYQLFKNIHNICKVDGVIMMVNPSERYSIGSKKKHHGLYHYTSRFYLGLAFFCKYEVVDMREMAQKYNVKLPYRKNFTYVTMIKKENNNFVKENDFKKIAVELGDYRQ